MLFEKDGNTYIGVNNPKATLKESKDLTNKITVALKDRNLSRDKKKELEESRIKILSNMIDLLVGAIINGVLDRDEYNLLKANVNSKHFKDNNTINSALSLLLKEKSKKDIDKKLSNVEIAKLLETPYVFKSKEEIEASYKKYSFNEKGIALIDKKEYDRAAKDENNTSVESNHPSDPLPVIVDKSEGIAYIENKGNYYAKRLYNMSSEESCETGEYIQAKDVIKTKLKDVSEDKEESDKETGPLPSQDSIHQRYFKRMKSILTNVFGVIWSVLTKIIHTIYETAKAILQKLLEASYALLDVCERTAKDVKEKSSSFMERVRIGWNAFKEPRR